MARQIGDIIIKGTLAGITFYIMDGKGYARKKSSLTGKQVKKDLRFRRTMESARRMGKASQLASWVYRSLAKEERVKGLFKELVSLAVLALKEGKEEAEVISVLEQRMVKVKKPVDATSLKRVGRSTIKSRCMFPKKLFAVPGGREESQRPVRETCSGTVVKESDCGRLPEITDDG